MADFVQNGIDLLCPNKGLGIFIVYLDVVINRLDEFLGVIERPTPDALAGDFSEPSFNQIKP